MAETAPAAADISYSSKLSEQQQQLYSLILALGFKIPSNRNRHLIHSVYECLQSGNDETRKSPITSMDLDKIVLYLGNPTIDLTVTREMRAFVLMRIAHYLAFQHDEKDIAIQYCDKAEELYRQADIYNSSETHNMLRVSNLSMCAFLCNEQGDVPSASVRIQRAQNIVHKTQARESKSPWVYSHINFMDDVSAEMT